jgi:hypothetical protein
MCKKCGTVGTLNGIPLRGTVVWCACSGWADELWEDGDE